MRRRRGIISGNFSKLGLLCLALVLGMGSLTVGYTAWPATVTIEGTVTTGSWERCETGYAYGNGYATCFDQYGFSNWGWTNGELSYGSYTFPIYASAGGCDINSGILVGTLYVEYIGETVTVTYEMIDGYTMEETHLYIGSEPLPRKNGDYTTAPGQYPYKHVLEDATTDIYQVNGFSGGGIYVVAHAVACWFEISPP